MFNNRMLAVAAVLALAVPTLGAAAPIVAPPQPEQLVEGHTVFTVIEVFNNTTTIRAEFAAAVAVLVREYDASQRVNRFPGVLWFNDQYLVNPEDNANAVRNFRYPCGGAVLAVNAGDPDPRVILANVGSSGETRDVVTKYQPITGTGVDYGDDTNPDYGGPGPDGTPGVDGDDPDSAWANVTTDGTTPSASSDVPTGINDPDRIADHPGLPGPDVDLGLFPDTFSYEESYLITDPNDHVWIVDKYMSYTRVGTNTLPGTSQVYARPVWAVNILGSPVFIPDDGIVSCGPYNDLITTLYSYAPGQAQGYDTSGVDDAVGTAWDPTVGERVPYRDTPPAGYAEPSQNGFCYNGNAAPCAGSAPTLPIRLYNALLYFKLADLTVAGAPRDHSDPVNSGDTNGCQVGTEWACPGGDDDREGNSHPFHPEPGATTGPGSRTPANPTHQDVANCPGYPRLGDAFYNGDEDSNHGGSARADAGDAPYCDNLHATRNVDIYFSPAGRPFAPVYRNWALIDTQGSNAPFHQHEHPLGP